MAVLAGTEGKVTFATGYATSATGWNVTFSAEIVDTTSWDGYASGSIWRSKTGGVKNWSGSYTALVDETADVTAALGGAPATAEFELDQGEVTSYIVGTITVTDIAVSNAFDGRAEVTISFEGSGAPTITTGS